MWQRIQTVFLGITIISLLVSLVQPLWKFTAEGTTVVLTPFYLSTNEIFEYMPYSLTAAFAVAAITLSIIIVRRYDNRVLQIKLGALNSLLLAGVMICAVWFGTNLTEKYSGAGVSYGIGLYCMFAAVICNWLAVRFIRRDEKLVRDSDRLR